MSGIEDRIDPETRSVYDAAAPFFEAFESIGEDMSAIRAGMAAMSAQTKEQLPPFDGTEEERMIPGLSGSPDVPVRIYKQNGAQYPEAVMVWVHGGGYVVGSADDMSVRRYTPTMTVVSVEYRMAPEHRSPAAAEDTCAAINWVAANAEELGIDPTRIILGGPSGGGGLAAGAALMNRDRGGPGLLYQLLIYPMIDDTHDTPSGHMDLPTFTWTREASMRAWAIYAEKDGASPYAAAARAEDLSGLPPTYLMTGDLDLFRDETITYASRLMAAGVPVDLAVFPGALHGFDSFASESTVAKRANAHQIEALKHVLAR